MHYTDFLERLSAALRAAFPDRAARLLREVRRRYPGEHPAHRGVGALCNFCQGDRSAAYPMIAAHRPGTPPLPEERPGTGGGDRPWVFVIVSPPARVPPLLLCLPCAGEDYALLARDPPPSGDHLLAECARALRASGEDETEETLRQLDRAFARRPPPEIIQKGTCLLCRSTDPFLVRGVGGTVCRDCLAETRAAVRRAEIYRL